MKRVTHPVCARCGKLNPDYESEVWNIRMCYICIRVVGDWLHKYDLIHGNPFAQEMFDGVFDGITAPTNKNQYAMWVRSSYAANASSVLLVDRLDSQK